MQTRLKVLTVADFVPATFAKTLLWGTAVVEWIMADTSLQIFILYWILYVWAPEVAAS